MGAENIPEPFVAALREQMEIQLAERRQEPIGIGDGVRRSALALIADLQPVVGQVGERQRNAEEAGIYVLEDISLVTDECGHLRRVRSICPDHGVVAVLVGAQYRVRVVVLPREQPIQIALIGPQMRAGDFVRASHLSVTPSFPA